MNGLFCRDQPDIKVGDNGASVRFADAGIGRDVRQARHGWMEG
jgi:hypothetical protein